jgi:hypothetical protein
LKKGSVKGGEFLEKLNSSSEKELCSMELVTLDMAWK